MTILNSIRTALGQEPFDLAIVEAHLVNVLTGEIYPADVGIYRDRITYVGPAGRIEIHARAVIQGAGRFLAPGLIDAHVHIESSMLTPPNFAEAVLPRGTTTVVIDPHEIANVLGMDGVRYMLEASEGLPLKVFVLAPSCVPAVPGLETSGAAFEAKEISEILSWPRVIGLAEVMDYPGVVAGSPRMMKILEAAAGKEALICGHCPGLRGAGLQAYLAAGPDSDHEVLDEEEMLEKLRAGMTIEAHESFHSQNIVPLVHALSKLPLLPPNVTFCIDDLPAVSLVKDGHLDLVLRHAVQAGLPPAVALRIATFQAAARCRLPDLGVIAPGKTADLVLFDDLVNFNVGLVVSSGKVVAKDGKMLVAIKDPDNSGKYRHTVTIPEILTAATFEILVAGKKPRVRVVEIAGSTSLTELIEMDLPVEGGQLDWRYDPDLCLVGVFERHGRGGHHALGLIKGFGLTAGAIASTVAHDSHNLIVIGRDPADMAEAARVLIGTDGGMVCVLAGNILGLVELPLAGLLSLEKSTLLAQKLTVLRQAITALGVRGKDPLMTITELALPVIPKVRFTDLGLVDVLNQELIPFWCE